MIQTGFAIFAICMLFGLALALVGSDWWRERKDTFDCWIGDALDEDDMSQW